MVPVPLVFVWQDLAIGTTSHSENGLFKLDAKVVAAQNLYHAVAAASMGDGPEVSAGETRTATGDGFDASEAFSIKVRDGAPQNRMALVHVQVYPVKNSS